MRVSRIRDFKNSTEVTIVLEGNDAEGLYHAILCEDCDYPKRKRHGKNVLEQLKIRAFAPSWKLWQD